MTGVSMLEWRIIGVSTLEWRWTGVSMLEWRITGVLSVLPEPRLDPINTHKNGALISQKLHTKYTYELKNIGQPIL